MDPHLTQLLNDNEPPSESAIREVEGLLPKPLLELSEIDSEVCALEEQLRTLRAKREQVQQVVNDYRRIISPIRQLPDDILHEIFFHCLPQNRNSIMTSLEAPVLLTRVSSRWRTIALSSPRLWAQLHIAFCDDLSIDRSHPSGMEHLGDEKLQERAKNALNLRCEVTRMWLRRSGTCPLSISVFYSSNAWNMEQIQLSRDSPTLRLFEVLLEFIQRWGLVELRMPLEIYRQFEAMFPTSVEVFSSLTTLRVDFHPQTSSPLATLDPGATPIVLFKAPNLQRLSLGGFTARSFWNLNSVPFTAQGQRLTLICCNGLLTVIEAFQLLRQCRNLQYCRLHLAQDFTRLDGQSFYDVADASFLNDVIFLPHLLSLSVLEDSTDPALTAAFYSSIDAPRLRRLEYHKQPYISSQEMLLGNQNPVPAILSLLRRASNLKILLIEPGSFYPADLRNILELVSPTVTHLVIGQEISKTSPRLISIRRRHYVPTLRQFDLNWLVIDPQSDMPDTPAPLLPHLESFEWSQGSVTDDILLQFIRGRIEFSPHRRAVLKHVRIVLDRVQQTDIVAEINRDGKFASEIQIDLDYLSKSPKKEIQPFSPSYGLARDGRTWLFNDI